MLTDAFAPGFRRVSIWRLNFVSELRRRLFMKKRKIAERVAATPAHLDVSVGLWHIAPASRSEVSHYSESTAADLLPNGPAIHKRRSKSAAPVPPDNMNPVSALEEASTVPAALDECRTD